MDNIDQLEMLGSIGGGLNIKSTGDLITLSELNFQDTSPMKTSDLSKINDDSSDEEGPPVYRRRKRIQQLYDSDIEKENFNTNSEDDKIDTRDSKTEDTLISFKSRGQTKSRIQISESSSDSEYLIEYEVQSEQKIRMTNKRNKMKQKFKGLLTSRSKPLTKQNENIVESSEERKNVSQSESSDSESISAIKIKQKIKKSIVVAASSICDPDTSDDEEGNITKRSARKQRQKKPLSTKMIEAQPMKMSAKEARENMQIIKSESNRMLREKAISLPYHKPKALTLKDIISRRKPAISSDGKVLPIKMNEEQLKQYVLQLEHRQKEMMELCKSESDEDMAEKSEKINCIQSSEKNQTDNKNEHTNNTEKNTEDLDIIRVSNNMNEKIKNVDYINTEKDIIKHVSTAQNYIDPAVTVEKDLTELTPATDQHQRKNNSENNLNNPNDSNTDIKLIYNGDSIGEEKLISDKHEDSSNEFKIIPRASANEECQEIIYERIPKEFSEADSQSVHSHYMNTNTEESCKKPALNSEELTNVDSEEMDEKDKEYFLSDDDIDMEDIDKMIENAEIINDKEYENTQIPLRNSLYVQPKLMGVPGMVIDLDGANAISQKRSGIELLKEKYTYFSKLKTPEELEREREKKLKPGAQHLKLKQELEEKIAEQRSLEWAKRLEEEKQHHKELNTILDDAEDFVDKIESEPSEQDEEEEREEELIEDDIDIKDKPKKHNPLIDDEAEESDTDACVEKINSKVGEDIGNIEDDIEENNSEEENYDDSSEDEESSESEEENQTSNVRRSRILKAFEDSDEEDIANKQNKTEIAYNMENDNEIIGITGETNGNEITDAQPTSKQCDLPGSSEDDVIQLAQRHASISEDLFTSQENSDPNDCNNGEISDLGTQTFSISDAKSNDFLCPSLPYLDPNLKAIADGFSQNLLQSQPRSTQSEPISEDILALCTGKFYDNEFVSQSLDSKINQNSSQDPNINNDVSDNGGGEDVNANNDNLSNINPHMADNSNVFNDKSCQNLDTKTDISHKTNKDEYLSKSILKELGDCEYDKPKLNKFFTGGQNKTDAVENTVMKKRLIIDSEDEMDNDTNEVAKGKKKKKKKLEDRALHYSDDEEEVDELRSEDDYESKLEGDSERIVEYDSEENEIEVKPNKPKKKLKATEFFEQEAELTSEDEWVGSGDEDEHGLDRMEREEGDDEVFHQGKLRNELGQIHMRDVLDQDKREVRLLQELLFEDGDLGGGHRQRKFRWRNAEDEEGGTIPEEFVDTQEEEMESEEQWRKQRHEREVFLRQMQKQDEDEATRDVTLNRTTIIKANLTSKSMSALLMEANQSKTQITDSPVVTENKSVKEVPSPKKTFSILRQNYHGSLLSRGRGALERLAALATPLAADEDAPKVALLATHNRNFVFSALTPDDTPKVTVKRKADVSTPKLVKKMRIEERRNHSKNSLLDHFKL